MGFRRTLIRAASSYRARNWAIDSSRLDLDTEYAWQVRKFVLHGGRQEDVDAISVDNGVFEFLIVPTRGMNLWSGTCDELPLGWESPVREVVHPSFVNLDSRGGLGWLEGFGEWINRCGLASFGAPGKDVVPDNTGAPVEVNLTLHGKISYLPASEVEVIVESAPSRRITVRGVVDETMMYGTNLRLVTEISPTPGSKSLTIADEIRNVSAGEQEMEILYHSNCGAPILEDGARVIVPAESITPRDERAAEDGMDSWNVYGPPSAGWVEQVYFLRLWADANGETEAVLHNRDADRGASMRFRTDELPCLTVWKNTGAVEDGYVTGIEPATGYPNLRSVERAAGRVPKLAPGASYETHLEITALTTADEVEAATTRVEAIRGGRETHVETEPSS